MTNRPALSHRTRSSLAAAALVLLSACGGGGSSESSAPPASSERELLPATIDARVDTALEPHIAINPGPSVTATQRLFVFLAGTDGTPSLYRLVLRTAAARGYHALGINYPNPVPVGVLCAAGADPDCFWDVRREVITGVNLSGRIDISVPNSIETRLALALAYLAQNFPNEGWERYLDGNAVAWSRVVVSGHSQGGGHAGVIAKLHPVARAVYFASPADWDTTSNAPASWMARASQTPADRQFGFGHLRDPLVPHNEVVQAWAALGLAAFGGDTSVDGATAPFGGSHMLNTDAEPASGVAASPYHGSPVLDLVTPLAPDRTPLYAPVWSYLAFP